MNLQYWSEIKKIEFERKDKKKYLIRMNFENGIKSYLIENGEFSTSIFVAAQPKYLSQFFNLPVDLLESFVKNN